MFDFLIRGGGFAPVLFLYGPPTVKKKSKSDIQKNGRSKLMGDVVIGVMLVTLLALVIYWVWVRFGNG